MGRGGRGGGGHGGGVGGRLEREMLLREEREGPTERRGLPFTNGEQLPCLQAAPKAFLHCPSPLVQLG